MEEEGICSSMVVEEMMKVVEETCNSKVGVERVRVVGKIYSSMVVEEMVKGVGEICNSKVYGE